MYIQEPSIDAKFLSDIHRIIDENLANEHFSVEGLANEVNLSRSMLHRRLKKLTGKSASDLITETRLSHAKQLLETNVATVSEIAYRVGFSSPSYFNKVFQKHFKVSPGELRKSAGIENQLFSYASDPETPEEPTRIHRHLQRNILGIIAFCFLGASAYYFFGSTPSSGSEKSIAVLPLDNLTGEPENEYFVEGMHDVLIGELGQIGSIRVISRTSTLRYKKTEMLLPDIARELGVNTIVEGSVFGAGDSVRILIQVIEVFPEERHVWAHEYHDGMNQVLKVQSAAIHDIAREIDVNLNQRETELLAEARTIDPEAYKAYLRGLHHLKKGTRESFETGLDYLYEAIENDPGDPFAYAGLAIGFASLGHGLSADEAFQRATAAADKAIKLDPTLDEAYIALALLYLYDKWDWAKAKEAFDKALAVNPNNELAHANFAWYYALFNDRKQSVYHAEKAVEIDPFSAAYHSWLALLYFENKEYQKAEQAAIKSLKLQTDIPYGLVALGWVYLQQGKKDLAIETHEKLPREGSYLRVFLADTYVKTGHREKARALWEELEEESKQHWVNPVHRGLMATSLGFTDRAFDLFNEGYENQIYPLIYLDFFPGTQYLKKDERYHLLRKKLNLPYEQRYLAQNQNP